MLSDDAGELRRRAAEFECQADAVQRIPAMQPIMRRLARAFRSAAEWIDAGKPTTTDSTVSRTDRA